MTTEREQVTIRKQVRQPHTKIFTFKTYATQDTPGVLRHSISESAYACALGRYTDCVRILYSGEGGRGSGIHPAPTEVETNQNDEIPWRRDSLWTRRGPEADFQLLQHYTRETASCDAIGNDPPSNATLLSDNQTFSLLRSCVTRNMIPLTRPIGVGIVVRYRSDQGTDLRVKYAVRVH